MPNAALHDTVRADLDAVEALVTQIAETEPSLNGLALYHSSSRALTLAIPLPRILRSGVVVGPRPVLDGLVLQEIATARLRVITLTLRGGRVLSGVGSLSQLDLELPSIDDETDEHADRHRHRHEKSVHDQRVEARVEQGVARWGDALTALPAADATVVVVPTSLVGKVRHAWPASVLSQIHTWVVRDPVGLSREDLTQMVTAAWAEVDARRDRAAMDRWHAAGGRQAVGPWATLEALLQHRVATLLIDLQAHIEGVHDSTTGAWRPVTTNESTEDSLAQDVVEEAIAVAVAQGVEILPIQDAVLAAPLQGIGAITRRG